MGAKTMRERGAVGSVLALAIAGASSLAAQDTAVYQNGGSPLYEAVSAAILKASAQEGLGAPAGPVNVSPTSAEASKDLAGLQQRGVKFVYTVGGGATSLASNSPAFSGIYLFVPNPSSAGLSGRAQWSGVSPYPDLPGVFTFLKGPMRVGRAGVLYTKAKNQETAKAFEKAAQEAGVGCVLLGVKGPEELEKALKPTLGGVDAIVLLLDPISFSATSLRFVVTACLEAKKPTVGFLDSLASSGVTVALHSSPEETAKRAVEAMRSLKEKKEDRKLLHPARFHVSVNDANLKAIGLAMDDSRISKRY